jgi:hypothetical protein
LFEDPRDPPRMLVAARFAEALLCAPGVTATYNDAFLLPPVMSLHQFNRPGVIGDVLAVAAKTVLNAPAPSAATSSAGSSDRADGLPTSTKGTNSVMMNCSQRPRQWRIPSAHVRSAEPTIRWQSLTRRAGFMDYPICVSSTPQ